MAVRVRILNVGAPLYALGGQADPHAGQWLAAYDPEAHGGQGAITWTADPDAAMIFDGLFAALACRNTVPVCAPVRPDGQPNRPLTAFTIRFDKVPS